VSEFCSTSSRTCKGAEAAYLLQDRVDENMWQARAWHRGLNSASVTVTSCPLAEHV
jgi:hypothetical protein